jgi:hypothetical protein
MCVDRPFQFRFGLRVGQGWLECELQYFQALLSFNETQLSQWDTGQVYDLK